MDRRRTGRRPAGRGSAPVRVAEEIRMRVSDLLLRGARDPRLSGVHLTRVDVTGDLSLARLWFRTMPGMATADEALAGARAASGWLRRELGRSLHLRGAPELEFRFDDAPDVGSRVEELLAQARSHSSEGDPGGEEE